MERLIQLVIDLWQFLYPIVVIRTYQRGIRFRWGHAKEVLEPGRRWKMYFVHEIEIIDITTDVINLPIQDVPTVDGKLVSLSANVEYEVEDAMLFFTKVMNARGNLADTAQRHIFAQARKKSLEDFFMEEPLTSLERSLRGRLDTRAKRWGIKITDVGFTSLVCPKPIRLIQDQGME